MSNDLGSAIKSNWYLVVAAVAFVVVGVVVGIVGGGDEDDEGAVVQQAGSSIDVVTVDESDSREGPTTTSYVALTDAEERSAEIDGLEAQIEADQTSSETPARMLTLMNLYAKERDYDSAVTVGEEFLRSFPEHNSSVNTMLFVAQMYEELNEPDLARRAFERLLNNVAPDSDLYQIAQQGLANL